MANFYVKKCDLGYSEQMTKITISRPNMSPTGLNIHVLSDHPDKLGEDRPVAFILPGGPGADHTGYLNYTCLQDTVDLVFHDPRGCGESDKGDLATYTMDNYIDDVESIRQHLSLKSIIVIGKSYGAMCALGYALRYPASTSKLVLSAGAPSFRFMALAKRNLERDGTPSQKAVCKRLWAGEFKTQSEMLEFFRLTQSLYSVKARGEVVEVDLAKKASHFSFDVLNQGFSHDFWHFDHEDELQKVTCPTLILAGREDWITDVSCAKLMAAGIPNSQLTVFEHASHAMEVDVTDSYFQTIKQFIR